MLDDTFERMGARLRLQAKICHLLDLRSGGITHVEQQCLDSVLAKDWGECAELAADAVKLHNAFCDDCEQILKVLAPDDSREVCQ